MTERKTWIKINNIALLSLDQIIRIQDLGIVETLYSALREIIVWFSDGGEVHYEGKEALEFLKWFKNEMGIDFDNE